MLPLSRRSQLSPVHEVGKKNENNDSHSLELNVVASKLFVRLSSSLGMNRLILGVYQPFAGD